MDMRLESFSVGSGKPILGIHGVISNHSFFTPLAAELKDEYQVISYDRRGYGSGNYKEITDFSLRMQAEDAYRILRIHTAEKAVIFGHSAGGIIAAELAILHPECIDRLLLMEPLFDFDEDSKRELAAWNTELHEYAAKRNVVGALASFAKQVGTESASGEKNIGNKDLSGLRQSIKDVSCFLYGELDDIQGSRPDYEDIKRLSVPVTIILSSQGKDKMYARAALRAAELFNWETVCVEGHHNAPKEHAACVARIIRELLSQDGKYLP